MGGSSSALSRDAGTRLLHQSVEVRRRHALGVDEPRLLVVTEHQAVQPVDLDLGQRRAVRDAHLHDVVVDDHHTEVRHGAEDPPRAPPIRPPHDRIEGIVDGHVLVHFAEDLAEQAEARKAWPALHLRDETTKLVRLIPVLATIARDPARVRATLELLVVAGRDNENQPC